MTAWRATAAVALVLLVGVPLIGPYGALAQPDLWDAGDLARISRLALNTILLVSATCLLAVPAGTLLAVLTFRTCVPGRRLALGLVVLLLFVPLPVIVSSWQGLLGAGGLIPIAAWASGVDRPWATGWGPAIWVHSVAAVPWVTCIIGLSLQWVEPELEETAALQLPPWRVILTVTLPRCRASIAAAALFVGLQTANEIAVTDMMLIPTLAEEVYTQFTLGGAGLERTIALALPTQLGLMALLAAAMYRLERTLPPLPSLLRRPRLLVSRPAWPWVVVIALALVVLIVPCAGLVWRLGDVGPPRGWSPEYAWHQLTGETWLLGDRLARSLATALLSGVLIAGSALLLCWMARGSVGLRALLLVVLAAAWVTPGPVIGIGLKELILSLLQRLPEGPWDVLLYRGPSPLPIMWAHLIRFLPPAVLFLWPVVRLLPRETIEAGQLDGAGPIREGALLVWPMTRAAVGVVTPAVAALALGELAAAGRVETPGWESFARMLFDRMHYGVDANVSAVSLLLLAGVAVAAGLAIALVALWRTLNALTRHV